MPDIQIILNNLISPPILFFFLGALAAIVKSDLDIPSPIPKLLSIYLLVAIGLKGGYSLSATGLDFQIVTELALSVGFAAAIPLIAWFIIKRWVSPANGAAIAGTYGSVSAVTFITASSFLATQQIVPGGHWVAALALMESPAIIIAVILYRRSLQEKATPSGFGWGHLIRDAFLNSSVFILLGSLAVGALTGEKGKTMTEPFTGGLFYGILMLFLLDMGLVAARRLLEGKRPGFALIGFSLWFPVLAACLAISISALLNLSVPSAFLLTVLSASASYIAVPAALRLAIPEANPGLYVTMSLAITFPFNIIIGIPLYLTVIQGIWRYL